MIVISPDRSFAPCILWDAVAFKWRCWYSAGPLDSVETYHRESFDAVNWSAPVLVRPAHSWGTTVVDSGEIGPARFRTAYWKAGADGEGVYTALSADGLTWTHERLIIRGPAYDKDIVDLWRNGPGWSVFVKRYINGRRQTYFSYSADFANWSEPREVWPFDGLDQPGVQFYGAAGPINYPRGIQLFFLRVLRDDSFPFGEGYTALAWWDGDRFRRRREPFFRGSIGQLDQAHAWVYGAAVKDGLLYLSYSGYRDGHKVGPRSALLTVMPVRSVLNPELRV